MILKLLFCIFPVALVQFHNIDNICDSVIISIHQKARSGKWMTLRRSWKFMENYNFPGAKRKETKNLMNNYTESE